MVKIPPDDFPRVTPYLLYEDVASTLDWLINAFGFEERFRMPGPDGRLTYVYVDDVDAHYERAKTAGAKILTEPADQFYGDRMYAAEDPEGHQWSFAQRIKDVPPEAFEQAV